MLKHGKRINGKRIFSEEFKRKVVDEYESGKGSVRQLSGIYGVSDVSVYKWIYNYSNYNKKSIQVVELKDSQMDRIAKMQARIAELERSLGQKQMNIDYLEKMIELASEELGVDIKKNSSAQPCGGSSTTGKK